MRGNRIQSFRPERLARINGGETMVPLQANWFGTVIRIAPLSAFAMTELKDLDKVHTLGLESCGMMYARIVDLTLI